MGEDQGVETRAPPDVGPHEQRYPPGSGAAYILSGPLVGDVSLPDARAMFATETEWDFNGYDVAGIGDVDGASWPDVAIAAPGVDDNGDGSGAVYVLTGQPAGTLGPADATATIRGAGPDDMFGDNLAGGGDADGDGVSDRADGGDDAEPLRERGGG